MSVAQRTSLLLSLLAALTVAGSLSFASDELRSYRLPITRDGVTTERVAYSFWSNEYPMPIIDVKSTEQGTTTVQGYQSLRKLPAAQVSCTIKNGIYHPWSSTEKSVINFYTLTSVRSYQALKPFTTQESPKFPAGTIVDNVVYGSEGTCVGTVRAPGKKPVSSSFGCDLVETADFKNLKPESSNDEFGEQWLYVKCAEGYNAFVSDTALLAQPGVTEGAILDFGTVGPAGSEPQENN